MKTVFYLIRIYVNFSWTLEKPYYVFIRSIFFLDSQMYFIELGTSLHFYQMGSAWSSDQLVPWITDEMQITPIHNFADVCS